MRRVDETRSCSTPLGTSIIIIWNWTVCYGCTCLRCYQQIAQWLNEIFPNLRQHILSFNSSQSVISVMQGNSLEIARWACHLAGISRVNIYQVVTGRTERSGNFHISDWGHRVICTLGHNWLDQHDASQLHAAFSTTGQTTFFRQQADVMMASWSLSSTTVFGLINVRERKPTVLNKFSAIKSKQKSHRARAWLDSLGFK